MNTEKQTPIKFLVRRMDARGEVHLSREEVDELMRLLREDLALLMEWGAEFEKIQKMLGDT